ALEHVDRILHLRGKFLAAELVHEAVRILAIGEGHDLHGHPVAEQLVAGTEGCLQSRLVTVVEQIGVSGEASYERRLRLGERGTQWRHHPGVPRGDEAYDIEIPFHDHHAVVTPDDVTRHVKAVQ